ncbi:phage major tail tube protein [Sulfurivirga sp.]|uniref:phage major tail tube protein n=1 Tax=Sulfurivirga sp. TaxID=2614236 RepID=UPI0025D62744|nr:phage major tail tube protein [Sulfurivirga sp.]
MADFPHAVIGISLTVEGVGYIGSVDAFKAPEIVEKTTDYRGGLVAGRNVFVGYEPPEAEFRLNREDVTLAAARAIVGRDVVLTFRATLDEKGRRIPVQWIIYGRVWSTESNDVKPGEMVEKTYKVAVEKFVKTIGGKPAEAFDIANGELKLSDHSVLEQVRQQLGL